MSKVSSPAFLERFDQVRLSTHKVIPSRYRGTIAEVITAHVNGLHKGRVSLYVKRRLSPIYVALKEVKKIVRDDTRVFPAR